MTAIDPTLATAVDEWVVAARAAAKAVAALGKIGDVSAAAHALVRFESLVRQLTEDELEVSPAACLAEAREKTAALRVLHAEIRTRLAEVN